MNLSFLYAKLVDRLRGTAVRDSDIHKSSHIGVGCNVANVTMGRYSYCTHDCQITNAEIGSFCSISDHVFIGGAEHPMSWVSMSPVFENVKHSGPTKRFSQFDVPPLKRTIIGSDVWIGHGVTIKQGITIGHGAVVGSNSLVTKDVPPYAIVGGIPAKVIKYRFDEKTISDLLNSEWWHKSDEEIAQLAQYVQLPSQFLKHIEK